MATGAVLVASFETPRKSAAPQDDGGVASIRHPARNRVGAGAEGDRHSVRHAKLGADALFELFELLRLHREDGCLDACPE